MRSKLNFDEFNKCWWTYNKVLRYELVPLIGHWVLFNSNTTCFTFKYIKWFKKQTNKQTNWDPSTTFRFRIFFPLTLTTLLHHYLDLKVVSDIIFPFFSIICSFRFSDLRSMTLIRWGITSAIAVMVPDIFSLGWEGVGALRGNFTVLCFFWF